jgi:G6PDH family F420-dependent oxidoreductase
MRLGYFLSSEETDPKQLVRDAQRAEAAGFEALWISDHFHPWNDEQGHSGFVWGTIGALSQVTSLRVTTAVTCPTMRIHPAIVAQAAATASVLLDGRFQLGVGSGEALNEHILGDRWPEADERLEQLEEAIEVMRLLWQGGVQSHRGRHYRVEHARVYDLPERPPEIIVSGFGEKATQLAGRVGDGFATVFPDADAVARFHASGGEGKLVAAGTKVCFGPDADAARETAHRLWPNDALPGELAQILPTPAHFEQASTLVTPAKLAESVPCGPDLDAHFAHLQAFADAGFDELFIQQIGPDKDAFFDTYARELIPRLSATAAARS